MSLEKPDPVRQFLTKEMIVAEIAARGKDDPLVRSRLEAWFKVQDQLGMSTVLAKRMGSELDVAHVYEVIGDTEAAIDTLKDALLDAEDVARRGDVQDAEEARKWVAMMKDGIESIQRQQDSHPGIDSKAA